MSKRLLYAAARGARLQFSLMGKDWTDTEIYVKPTDPRCQYYRIHPEDEHLQYGEFSSRFRERAEGVLQGCVEPWSPLEKGLMAPYWASTREEFEWVTIYNPARDATFLLLVSEALADRGM